MIKAQWNYAPCGPLAVSQWMRPTAWYSWEAGRGLVLLSNKTLSIIAIQYQHNKAIFMTCEQELQFNFIGTGIV